jgi:hypothetical protein
MEKFGSGMEKFGSGIRDKYLGSALLILSAFCATCSAGLAAQPDTVPADHG